MQIAGYQMLKCLCKLNCHHALHVSVLVSGPNHCVKLQQLLVVFRAPAYIFFFHHAKLIFLTSLPPHIHSNPPQRHTLFFFEKKTL